MKSLFHKESAHSCTVAAEWYSIMFEQITAFDLIYATSTNKTTILRAPKKFILLDSKRQLTKIFMLMEQKSCSQEN